MRITTTAWFSADESGSHLGAPRFSPSLDESGLPRRRVALLAEDNPADVLLVQEAIELHGLPVDLYVVEDGEKALGFLQTAENDSRAPCPEVLLLDLNLPRRSGNEVLERVRKSDKFKNLRVLIISSSDAANEQVELGRLTRFFHKPTSYDAFMKVGQTLKQLLEEEIVN